MTEPARSTHWRTLTRMVLITIALLIGLIAAAFFYGIVVPLQPHSGPLPALTAAQKELAGRLREHVTGVASRPHNVVYYEALIESAAYIEAALASAGIAHTKDEFPTQGRLVRNIEVVIDPGAADTASAALPSVVVGAHYDSADDSPGANDNGTGVAALIELARVFHKNPPRAARLRLVFYVNEEDPYGRTDVMGSWRHARRLKAGGENVRGMISLETLGYFSDAPASQKFPFPFGLIFPDRGNFVAFVGLPGSRSFLWTAIRSFRRNATFPSLGGVAPGSIPGIDWSDHWSYDREGFAAIMLTDTAPFRNPQYHLTTDLPSTVDYDSLARITAGLEPMIRDLAD